MRLLRALANKSRHIVQYLDCYVEGSAFTLVLEYADAGTLKQLLVAQRQHCERGLHGAGRLAVGGVSKQEANGFAYVALASGQTASVATSEVTSADADVLADADGVNVTQFAGSSSTKLEDWLPSTSSLRSLDSLSNKATRQPSRMHFIYTSFCSCLYA